MALHFVSTSVLSSSDGIAFENEVKKDSEEVRKASAAAKAAENKPLFEQLEALKAKKQEEYDANTKLIFAPPRAVDEEDEQFFRSLAETKTRRKGLMQQQEESKLATFRDAVNHKHAEASTKPKFKLHTAQKESSAVVTAAPIITRKRKVDIANPLDSGVKDETKKFQKADLAADDITQIHGESAPVSVMDSFISGYGSEDEDEC